MLPNPWRKSDYKMFNEKLVTYKLITDDKYFLCPNQDSFYTVMDR